MKTFILIKRFPANTDCPPSFEWWEQEGKKIYNQSGGYNFLISSDEIVETVKAKDWDILFTPENIAKTTTYKNLVKNSTNKELKCGWLEPNGKMHYCRYQDHITYVDLVLNSSVSEIEDKGWLHVYRNENTVVFYANGHRITMAQANTLRDELGLKVFDEDILYQ
jgi:hypothetical protein